MASLLFKGLSSLRNSLFTASSIPQRFSIGTLLVVVMGVSSPVVAASLSSSYYAFVGTTESTQDVFREDVLQRICDSGYDIDVFVDEIGDGGLALPGGNDPASALPLMKHKHHAVVHCVADNLGTTLDGEQVAIYQSSQSAEAGAVFAVAHPENATSSDMQFMDASVDPAACAAVNSSHPDGSWLTGNNTRFHLYECNDEELVAQIPDGGVSEVEPARYTGSMGMYFDDEPLGVTARSGQTVSNDGLDVKMGPGLLYGIAVTLPLYNELVEDQALAGYLPSGCAASNGSTQSDRDALQCMPDMPSSAVRSIFQMEALNWNELNLFGESLDVSTVQEGELIHICRRLPGTGAHARAGIHYVNEGCNLGSGKTMPAHNDGDAINFFGFYSVGVYGNRDAEDMDACLHALATGDGYDGGFTDMPPSDHPDTGDSSVVPGTSLPGVAIPGHVFGYAYNREVEAFGIGHASLASNTDLSKDYRFVRINKSPPTLEAAVSGVYKDVYYMSYHYRKPNGTDPDLRIGGLRASAPTAGEIQAVSDLFGLWDQVDISTLAQLNAGMMVDPDGVSASGDEWQGGYLMPKVGAASRYTAGVSETPWARATATGVMDSCQSLHLVK